MDVERITNDPTSYLEAQFAGWEYWTIIDDDEDVRKIAHFALQRSEVGSSIVHAIDFSPYDTIPFNTLKQIVDLGFPSRFDVPDHMRDHHRVYCPLNASMVARLSEVRVAA